MVKRILTIAMICALVLSCCVLPGCGVERDDPGELKLRNTHIEEDYIVAAGYESLRLENAAIDGVVRFEAGEGRVKVTVSQGSSLGGIVFDRQGVLDNSGHIKELKIDAPVRMISQGRIDCALVSGEANLADDGSIVIIKDGRATNVKGMLTVFGGQYFVLDDGSLAAGLTEIAGQKFFFGADGIMRTGIIEVEGGNYYFDKESGAMAVNAWINEGCRADWDGTFNYTKTGNEELDGFVGRVLDQITNEGMTEREKMKAVYDWMPANIGWRGVVTNFSSSGAEAFQSFVYPESEVVELAYYAYQNRKGSCEHYAALASVFLKRLGYKTRVIYGLRKGYAYEGDPWGEHGWAEVTIEGRRYHFDPQYTRTHMRDRLDYYFLLPEEESRQHHKW